MYWSFQLGLTVNIKVKILSLNCQDLGLNEKRLDYFNYLKSKQCDMYCLQDIHSITASEKFIEAQWDNRCLFLSLYSISRGVAVLFNKNVDFFEIHNSIHDPGGKYITIDLTVDSNPFILVNFYGRNLDRSVFFDNLILKVNTFDIFSISYYGNINLVQDPKLDYFNYKCMNNIKSHRKLLELKDKCNLIYPFRELHPDIKRYSWRRQSPLKQARFYFY